jgi:histidine triad (HIT) family protein
VGERPGSDCLFCGMVAGDIPCDVVLSDDRIFAFRDINPQAPTHVLVIPRQHFLSVPEVASADPDLAGAMLRAAGQIAQSEGLGSYRLVANTGADAGQTVFHAHVHLLGGRSFTWPPG